ncbi:hypothetical protein CAPTEDRAFT_200942 [Capitella teleta]|uniref:Uncharacterized protein n=1 Tax=Capitella teleta TaxID=283909 RepID=R7T496_CAPTE|nr:hypothetical protein CAPTEDRAFT_200942 [Capitella teleta]|eukprot:ELT87668.1 hypothetical protein CAPTEDRAFT_200942 [Capitella teleta]
MQEPMHWADYCVLAAFLTSNFFIGLYYNFKEKLCPDDFFQGKSSMSWTSMVFSLVMASVSATFVVGGPAQVMYNGSAFVLMGVGLALGEILAGFVLVPILYPLKLKNVSEYVELRFGSVVAKNCITLSLLLQPFSMCDYQKLVFSSINLYTAATVLSTVTGYQEWHIICLIGGSVAIYSALGGLKGTVYTGLLQAGILLAMINTVLIVGSNEIGGIQKVFNVARLNNRSDLFEVLWVSGILYGLVTILCYLPGFVLYAWYDTTGCDPLRSGAISNQNQVRKHQVLPTGVSVALMALLFDFIGGNIVEANATVMLFIRKLYIRFHFLKGGVTGFVASVAILLWIIIGSVLHTDTTVRRLPTAVRNCTTVLNAHFTPDSSDHETWMDFIYRISYFHLAWIGAAITVIMGLPVSLLTRKRIIVIIIVAKFISSKNLL